MAAQPNVGGWSINCFYVAPDARGDGLLRTLLDAAVQHARNSGADTVEAYPVDTGSENVHPDELFTGALSTFLEAGFHEVVRRSPARPVLRLDLTR